VVTRVRSARVEVLTAQREIKTSEEVVRLSEEGLAVAQKLQKAGAGTQPDVLRAQVELEQNRIRLSTAQRRSDAAWRLLATAVGLPELPGLEMADDLDAPAPVFAWAALRDAVLERSSEMHEVQALHLQAEELLKRARAEVCPNLLFVVRPVYSFPDQDFRVLLEAGAALPIFNRNQGNILSAQADVIRTRAEIHQKELQLTERLTLAFQRYRVAFQQSEAYRREIVPHATESLRLVRLGYERGDPKYDYTAVLQAQRTLEEARLLQVQALGELWRAVSEILGLLQEDEHAETCPAP
jgi:cobalt-zinc-cadmium efflux system outer membrane protein